ncbi:putative RNA-directed DNA polymerase, eukaryota, reverse transcriptase zinc-binding domain protein [Tanacetum coccineum]
MSHDIEKRKTAFGFKDNGAKDGWYEGDGIFVMASLIITVAVVMIHGLSYMATSFINIGDAVYLSNERLFLLKVDFKKAFDSLEWKFLDNIMNQMGFSSKWRMWIDGCLKSAYCSVPVNRSPTKEFKIQKGICQGDPLSPFLFIIAVEALSIALKEVKSKHIFEGVKVGSNKVDISHLQFADDALILGKWSIDNAKNLCRILRCFNLASGLKVNFSKSKLFGVGVSTSETNNLAYFLNCQPSKLPCSYLGLPIGANMNVQLESHY